MPELYSRRTNGRGRQESESESGVKNCASHYSQGGSPADIPSGGQTSKPSAASPAAILSELAGGLDGDKLLIAALLLLLLREGGDKRLVLALGYILF
ncbi:MAG: hypothetical protein IKO47_00495 [Ruminococcus sp.]|nr:hypothetical protein [Ruminococcus sp.]